MPRRHTLKATPATVHWGYFDAAEPPVLTIDSGDTVTVETVSGAADALPSAPYTVLSEHREILAKVPRKMPGHICTGPIAVRGARPGHVLEVRIDAIEPRQDWGYNFVRPLAGALPDDFDRVTLIHIAVDAERGIGRVPWGDEIPLRPFFGVMGTAPPAAWGMVSTLPPRRNGGNLDNKELVAGTTLYLPVFVDGANLSVGDGHGAQGDGEVCVTAIETALRGTFTIRLRDDMRLEWPRAETAGHVMTMAFDPDLDDAARTALRDMIGLIVARRNLTREQAYALCSLAADLRVTQMVNGNNGIHVMLEKKYAGAG